MILSRSIPTNGQTNSSKGNEGTGSALTPWSSKLSEDTNHAKILIEAREALVSRRRVLAVALVKDPEHTIEFVAVQNAINAVEEAIKQERSWGG
jgi:hypothetical protein